MVILYVEECQQKALKDGAITALIKHKISDKINIGDNISILIDGNWYAPAEKIIRTITDIKRIRLDELTPDQIKKCGYEHKDILMAHLKLEDRGELYYFIDFSQRYVVQPPIIKTNTTCNCTNKCHEGKEKCNSQLDTFIKNETAPK